MFFPPPETLFREPKDVVRVLWKVSLKIEGERPLLHVRADFSENHS